MSTIPTERLANVFVELAHTLVDEFDLIDFLHTVTARTSELAGAAAAGLVLADHSGQLQFMAASEERAKLLELFQIQANEGPCFDCFTLGVPVINAELREAEDRWPKFAPEAVAAGFRSVHAFPMRIRRERIGALNLFGTEVGRMEGGDEHIMQSLTDVATIGLLNERAIRRAEILTDQLQTALNSRVIIEQAKGVLAQTFGVTVDEAFERLRAYSRRHGAQLGQVARTLVTNPADVPELASPVRD